MVNLEKWEEIEYTDIRADDLIKMIREDGIRTFIYKSMAVSFDEQHNWWVMDGKWYASAEEDYGYARTFYRRKPKPFDFPTSFGSIIQVTKSIDPESVGHRTIRGNGYFVLNQSGMWRNESGEGYNVSELLKFFAGFKVISKGVEG